MIKKICHIQQWVEEKVQNYCDGLSPRKRLVSIVLLACIFGSTSLYISITAFYRINTADREQMEIAHIKQLQLHTNDSIQQLKFKQDER